MVDQEQQNAVPEGWEVLGWGGPELVGWVKPEKDLVVTGKVTDWIARENDEGKLNRSIIIELDRAMTVYKKDSVEVAAQPGDLVALPVNSDNKKLAQYIECQARCFVQCLGKETVTIKGHKRKMWKWVVAVEPGMEPSEVVRPPRTGSFAIAGFDDYKLNKTAADDGHTDFGDDVPFD